jgi:hypothetical protein
MLASSCVKSGSVVNNAMRGTDMLVEVLGDIRDVEVGVALIGELLELGVE